MRTSYITLQEKEEDINKCTNPDHYCEVSYKERESLGYRSVNAFKGLYINDVMQIWGCLKLIGPIKENFYKTK